MNHSKYLKEAYKAALKSPDASNQNGAVLVYKNEIINVGINKFPHGFIPKPEHLERPRKYNFINHAEWEAVTGVDKNIMKDSVLYCPWFACTICSRAIVMSGCRNVIGHYERMQLTPDRWKEEVADGQFILESAGVEMNYIKDKFNVKPIYVNGEYWTP